MLTPNDLYPYQRLGIQHLLDHPYAMLWEDVGLGKSVQALTAFLDLQDRWEVMGMLIVGTKRLIVSVWEQEAQCWSHTKHIRFSRLIGTADQRKAALNVRADIYLISYENLPWLVTWVRHFYLAKNRLPPFDAVCFDEVTKMKNAQALRSKEFQHIRPFMRRLIGLTGEPASNGYIDLHGQYLAVDGGKRLGADVTSFRSAFFTQDGYDFHRYRITRYGQEQIKRRIHDITLELSAEQYLDLPPVIERDVHVVLPPKARRIYDQVEADFFAQLDSGAVIEAPTEGAKGMKCLQIAGGACYVDGTDRWDTIHRAKLDALEDVLEEQGGKPVLLAYAFRHEAARLAERFPQARFLSSELSDAAAERTIQEWNAGDIPLLCGHPISLGYGLNIQFGGSTLCWYGFVWSLDLYRQFNGRLAGGHRRRGRVTLLRLVAQDTMDEAILGVLSGKAAVQKELRQAIREYREKRR